MQVCFRRELAIGIASVACTDDCSPQGNNLQVSDIKKSFCSGMTGSKVAALRVKGLRSIGAWLELQGLDRGSLIGICGPNGTSLQGLT